MLWPTGPRSVPSQSCIPTSHVGMRETLTRTRNGLRACLANAAKLE